MTSFGWQASSEPLGPLRLLGPDSRTNGIFSRFENRACSGAVLLVRSVAAQGYAEAEGSLRFLYPSIIRKRLAGVARPRCRGMFNSGSTNLDGFVAIDKTLTSCAALKTCFARARFGQARRAQVDKRFLAVAARQIVYVFERVWLKRRLLRARL